MVKRNGGFWVDAKFKEIPPRLIYIHIYVKFWAWHVLGAIDLKFQNLENGYVIVEGSKVKVDLHTGVQDFKGWHWGHALILLNPDVLKLPVLPVLSVMGTSGPTAVYVFCRSKCPGELSSGHCSIATYLAKMGLCYASNLWSTWKCVSPDMYFWGLSNNHL